MNPDFAICAQHVNKNLIRDGFTKAFVVDTKKAKYQGRPWKQLSTFDKRKFENLIVIINSHEKLKVLYV